MTWIHTLECPSNDGWSVPGKHNKTHTLVFVWLTCLSSSPISLMLLIHAFAEMSSICNCFHKDVFADWSWRSLALMRKFNEEHFFTVCSFWQLICPLLHSSWVAGCVYSLNPQASQSEIKQGQIHHQDCHWNYTQWGLNPVPTSTSQQAEGGCKCISTIQWIQFISI